MRAPKYYISLGGVNLHRVYAFRLTSGRDIESYDGIGSGKFNVPDAHNPREWTIDCELLQNGKETAGLSTWSASELFKEFEAWLGKTDAPVRMVKTDSLYPAANLSVLVWLKSYTKKESDEQGVYDTEIVVEEYKPVGIKTTGVPYVKRPGKAPVPKKVTITKKRTAYRTKRKTGVGTKTDANLGKGGKVAKIRGKELYLADSKTGKPVTNAAKAQNDSTYAVSSAKTGHTINGITYNSDNDSMAEANLALVKTAGQKIANGVSAARKAAGKAISKWWSGVVKANSNNKWY